MTLRLVATLLTMGTLLPCSAALAQDGRPVRLFPQFVGTWVLDEAASTGRLMLTPRVPVTLTISTTATELTVVRRLRLQPTDRTSETPPREVYRLDGSETSLTDPRLPTGVTLDRSLRFTLAADMLVLTIREGSRAGGFTQVTDALELQGDVLLLHRQLTSMTDAGAILVMQEPTNNLKHTYVYRRTQ